MPHRSTTCARRRSTPDRSPRSARDSPPPGYGQHAARTEAGGSTLQAVIWKVRCTFPAISAPSPLPRTSSASYSSPALPNLPTNGAASILASCRPCRSRPGASSSANTISDTSGSRRRRPSTGCSSNGSMCGPTRSRARPPGAGHSPARSTAPNSSCGCTVTISDECSARWDSPATRWPEDWRISPCVAHGWTRRPISRSSG